MNNYTNLKCKYCNKEMKVRNDYLKKHSGICVSCQKKGNKNNFKHGDYKKRLYKIWLGLKHRRYKTYKPKVCKEWEIYEDFKNWALENGYNDNLTIDRIDKNKDYDPNNCQWITREENAAKDKRLFNFDEKLKIYEERKKRNITQIEMAKKIGVSRKTIQRLEKDIKEWRMKNEYI